MSSTKTLADHVQVRGRFARSVRLDQIGGSDVLAGYLPTGRSLEVVRRITRGLTRPDGARAFSVTGPYGSGKSSLAVMIDALLGPSDSDAYRAAVHLAGSASADLVDGIIAAREAVSAGEEGFVRAVITAPQREPVTTTVLRALLRGAERFELTEEQAVLAKALRRAESPRYQSPSFTEIRKLIEHLTAHAPVLLIIDEFGKNLEAYADSGGDGDLYLLQELAESTLGEDRLPMVVVTIQHLAFEAYAADATAAQRREWAKVQGRLEDIPFVDSAPATRALIASALVHSDAPVYRELRDASAQRAATDSEARGVVEVADPSLIAACYPLHPSTLLVLPDLCARYGQNERTLFSFLASDEPMSARQLLASAAVSAPLPWVRLDRVYDYFVQSASTFVGASRDATRWIEVETTIRDAHGLSEPQRQVLKTIGVLNLVAAVGTVRASRDLVCFSLSGAGGGLEDDAAVTARIDELVELGLLVHRDFAGEYRIWRGSDFDLQGALEAARRRAKALSLAKLLEEVSPLPPLVAGRHTVKTGTTRAFSRAWTGRGASPVRLPRPDSALDGVLLYVVDAAGEVGQLPENPHRIPVVTVTPQEHGPVADAAAEVFALQDVAADPAVRPDDHAVRRELAERRAYAVQRLEEATSTAYGSTAAWSWENRDPAWQPSRAKPLGTSFLSDVLDSAYSAPWRGAYEAINRAELTSQGAKARRLVLEAMVNPASRRTPGLGFEGDGPEVAIWRSVLHDTGLLRSRGIAEDLAPPWRPVWNRLMAELDAGVDAPVSAVHLLDVLMLPPHGLRAGVASIVFVTALLHRASDIAVYEHGTFKPRLDAPLIERLVRNPANFAVKFLAAADNRSVRGRVVTALAEQLQLPQASVLGVVSRLVRVLRDTDRYVRTTTKFGMGWSQGVDSTMASRAAAVRDALLQAHEPDELLFRALPSALGFAPVLPARAGAAGASMARREADVFAALVVEALGIIETAESELCEHIASRVLDVTRSRSATTLAADAELLLDVDIVAEDVRVFSGHARLAAYADTTAEWVARIATATTGKPPKSWTDTDVGPLLDRITRVAANFRRVAALASLGRHRDSAGEPFSAWGLAATATDGSHNDVVAVVPLRFQAAADATLDEAVGVMAQLTGADRTGAEEMLLAAVAGRLLRGEANTGISHGSGKVEGTRAGAPPATDGVETA